MKQYLGDSVYVEFDEDERLILTTEDGESVSNKIYLDPEVFSNLLVFRNMVKHPNQTKFDDSLGRGL